MSVATIAALSSAGELQYSDGYRTQRSELAASGFQILRVADINNGSIKLDGSDFVDASRGRAIGAKEATEGDIVLTTKGTVGRLAIVPPLPRKAVYSPQVCYFRVADGSCIDRRWLFYWFQSEQFWSQARDRMNNTDMAAYINLSDVGSLAMEIPARSDQFVIAEVLSALDNKIAALQRVNISSERLIARELGSLLANEATQSRTVGEVVRFRNNERRPLSSAERNERVGTVPYYGATSAIDTVDEAIFDDRLVLVGEDGSVVDERTGAPVLQYISGPAWVNNHAHVLEGTTISTELLFHVLGAADVRSFVTGAVQPKLSMTNLKKVPVNIPSGDDLLRIEDEVQGLTALQRANTTQINRLQKLRDTLLPALMSGKLRVKDAERAVEDVL
ncbi:restriction endonuclease subunit S [Rathayibacter sp. AY1D4]|uniref:restriction endonuclease subunit S n=1 Tax=Rathayibacter sp. AY1D4 TaxID=2080545 RepID=UPI000CE9306F|nr:restriction endonuclease subunit S [Rathayibacter sp. AY1D4]PPH72977.1 restriction endonuclease subunit S [Rathayibacter sp. AY1D4]